VLLPSSKLYKKPASHRHLDLRVLMNRGKVLPRTTPPVLVGVVKAYACFDVMLTPLQSFLCCILCIHHHWRRAK
jgi:hypothetical protein